ncbi:hypothetical protein ACFL5Z_12100 [Planctomycetota bacterium]
MKRNMILLTVIGICCETSLAINAIGPPITTLKKDQFAIGFDYSFMEVNIEVSGYGISPTLDDVEFDSYLGKIGYGITHNWQIIGYFGTTDIDWQKAPDKFNDNTDITIGFCSKATVIEAGPLPWGLALQVNWLREAEDKSLLGTYGYTGGAEAHIWELQIATGPTVTIDELSLYGGPFVYWIRGDVEIENAGANWSFEVKEESIFGGFIGLQIDISDYIVANVEYQVTNDCEALGAGVAYKF